MSDLKLATLDEIFQEIASRTRAALLVVTTQPMKGTTHEVHAVSHHGGWATAIGLARYADFRLLSAARLDPNPRDGPFQWPGSDVTKP